MSLPRPQNLEQMRLKLTGVLLTILVLVSACESTQRPTRSEWAPKWTSLTSVIPDLNELRGSEMQTICAETVANLRVLSETVMPTPNQTIDGLAEEWAELAQSSFFQCPPDNADQRSFSEVYSELERLEQAILAAIEESPRGGLDSATTSPGD